MSLGKSSQQSQGQAASVWGGQSPYLQNLYGQGQQMIGQTQQIGQQIMPQIQQAMTPQGYGELMQSAANPFLQNLQSGSVQAMNLGGSRQGVAQGQIGQEIGQSYLQNLPGMYNLGMQAGGWGGLQQQAQLLGSPTVLGGATSSSGSKMQVGA